jgi:hypothetical protein
MRPPKGYTYFAGWEWIISWAPCDISQAKLNSPETNLLILKLCRQIGFDSRSKVTCRLLTQIQNNLPCGFTSSDFPIEMTIISDLI